MRFATTLLMVCAALALAMETPPCAASPPPCVTPPAPPAAPTEPWQPRWKELTGKVDEWSSRMRECVQTPPSNPLEQADFDNFTACRSYRCTAALAAFNRGGADALAAEVRARMDRPSCRYGNCGEGAWVFACAAREIGIPDKDIQIWENEHHIFVTVPHPTDAKKRCLLDRWTVTDGGSKAGGKVLCDVTLVGGVVHIEGKPSKNPWYRDITPLTMHDYFTVYAKDVVAPAPIEHVQEHVDRCDVGVRYRHQGMNCSVSKCERMSYAAGKAPAGLVAGRTYWKWTSACVPNDPR